MRTPLCLTVVFLIHTCYGQVQTCTKGSNHHLRFGPLCEYLCHCGRHQCNRETGECPQNVECDVGWMGSGCQYANAAYGAKVFSNHLFNENTIVDGNGTTCPSLREQRFHAAYVTIDFGHAVRITEIHLEFSDSAAIQPFRINVVRIDDISIVCNTVSDFSGNMTFVVMCDRAIYGRYVNITSEGLDFKLHICEIKLPTGRNMAYGKPAYQSSQYLSWEPSKAVDGDTTSTLTTCTHTKTTRDPWWSLDLQAHIRIMWFRIFNRENNFFFFFLKERLKNFRISLSEDNITFQECYQDKSQNIPLIIIHVLNPEASARFVKIDLQGNDRILTLCEVQVFGDCDDLYYGNCSASCGNCAAGKPCNKVSGLCDNACMDGWQTGKCDKPCDDYHYGNCSTICGACRHDAVCDKVNGSCPFGLCLEGWNGDKCDTVCDSTHFGQNCALQCGKCLTKTCDSITGNCLGAATCEPGWQGLSCNISYHGIHRHESVVNAGILTGSAGIGVVIVVIIGIVIFIIMRRRKHKQTSPKMPSLSPSSSKKEDIYVYENSTFLYTNNSTLEKSETRNEASEHKPHTSSKLENTVVIHDTETYYNVRSALPIGTIPLPTFWDYVQEKFVDENYFSEEFDKLPSGLLFPTTVAIRPENRHKNRYKNLYAYDSNRVLLEPLTEDDNDYINASFVDGFSCPKMYIASQGTTKDNINDFWRMLWQYKVEKIVMLTELVEGGKHKCELYWPIKEGETSLFGNVTVKLLDTDSFADYEIRTLEMSVNKQSTQLTHFHFTAWPDKGVPKTASSIIQFWNRVNKIPTKHAIVVHCSAGIGRTGTYIALDYLVRQGNAEGHVNVFACISNLRRQRVNMVQTKEQYCFLHEILAEALMLSGTATISHDFPKAYKKLLELDNESAKLKLQLEYERMQIQAINHEAVYATFSMEDDEIGETNVMRDEYSAAKKPVNKAKNRDDSILPAKRHRVHLSTPVSSRNDYINAVTLPSHKEKEAFILTQMPLPDTVIDLWRMINNWEVKTIVMLNSMDSKDHDTNLYWPNEGKVGYGPFCVQLKTTENFKHYRERILSFSVTGDENDRIVKQFQFTDWAENSDVPGSTDSFLYLLDAVKTWQIESGNKPVVVHCLNGADRSGLYCVMTTVIERLNLEKDVAIVQTIKRMRSFRQQIIPNYEQFWFCHECILQYMKMFETYSNF